MNLRGGRILHQKASGLADSAFGTLDGMTAQNHVTLFDLTGVWELEVQGIVDPSGSFIPSARLVTGQLIYTAGGQLSVHLLVPGQDPFEGDDPFTATEAEMVRAWPTYQGYFGTFTVDAAAGTVTHHLEGCSFPNIVGGNQVRSFHLDGDNLTLDADEAWGRLRLFWRRRG